ncbi:hypothetical protein E2C01_075851 [Portunus trituberculatus]|uniref:Uncharacterized protein n=1 Tax=Portunus trituberculatus TaxID=210409 RepID=A0A5B7IG50_PORTR|nr:hypothetical protein [Portunus trituberculatus]
MWRHLHRDSAGSSFCEIMVEDVNLGEVVQVSPPQSERWAGLERRREVVGASLRPEDLRRGRFLLDTSLLALCVYVMLNFLAKQVRGSDLPYCPTNMSAHNKTFEFEGFRHAQLPIEP